MEFMKEKGGTISSAGTLLGGAASALGAIRGGEAAGDRAKYEAAVFRNNKILVDRQSAQVLQQAREQIQENQIGTAQAIATQQASFAARGVITNRDSAVDLAADIARIGALDRAAILQNAEEKAYQLAIQGINFETQAIASEAAGKDAKRASYLKASGSLLKAGTTVASKWLDQQKPATGDTKLGG